MSHYKRGVCEVLGLLLLGIWALEGDCGVIRTHAVVNSNSVESVEAKKGLIFFQQRFAEIYPEGFEVGGFRFNFSHTVDVVPVNFQTDVIAAWDRALNGSVSRGAHRGDRIKSRIRGNAGAHFVFGTDEENYQLEELVAEWAGRIMLHATAPTVLHKNVRKKFFYSMVPKGDSALESILSGLIVKGINQIALVQQKDDFVNAAIAAFVQSGLNEISTLNPRHMYLDISEEESQESVERVVADIISNKIEVIIGCTREKASKLLINSFWEKKYPLRAQFYTYGPSSQTFVDALGPKAHGLLSPEVWHYTAVIKDNGFFGTPYDFMADLGFEPAAPTAAAAATWFVMMEAFKASFKDCDISKSGGDVDKMLFDSSAISCVSGEPLGYDRILQEMRYINIDTIYGPVEFGKYGENEAGTSYISQVHGKDEDLFPTVVLPPYVSNTSLPWRFTMPWPNPFAPEMCPPGTFTTEDVYEPCRKCASGTVTEAPGSLECHKCPPNYYQPNEGETYCYRCPDNTKTVGYGAKNITSCGCFAGFFHKYGRMGAPCEPCPFGADCIGQDELPIPKAGFWKASTSAQIYSCDAGEDACPGGDEEACAVGYTGRMCSQCEHGYYKLLENCYTCRSKLQVIGIIAAVLVLWYFINTIVSARVETVELILNWTQLVNIIGAVQLNWPGVFQNIFSVASLLDFDIDVIQPNCLTAGWSFKKVFLSQLMLPVWMSSMAFGWYCLCSLRYRLRRNSDSVHSWIGKLLLKGVPKYGGDEWIAFKLDSAIARTLAALEVTYITTARYCISSLRCEDIAGVLVMSSSSSVECGTVEHKGIIGMAVVGLAFYTIGYIVFTSVVLFNLYARKKFSDTQSLHRYGFIYERFELGYSWTAVMMLMIRILFVLSIVFSGNPLSAAAALAIITVAWLLIHVYTLPYVEEATDVLQTFLLVSLMALGYAGVLFSESKLPEDTKNRVTFGGAFIIFLMVGTFIVLFIREVVQKIKIMIIQCRHKKAVLGSLGSSEDIETVLDDLLVAGVDLELYKSFKKEFLYDWLKNADKHTLLEFDRMSVMLRNYLGDDSYLSFLSLETVARFWRKLVKGFPEIIDFLAGADDDALDSFSHFVDVLYRDFFVYGSVYSDTLHTLVEWKDHAPLAQWLLICTKEERQRFAELMGKGYKAHAGSSVMALRAGNTKRKTRTRNHKDIMTRVPSALLTRMRSLTVKHQSAVRELSEHNGPLQHHTPDRKHQRTLERMKHFTNSWRSQPYKSSTGSRFQENLSSVSEGTVYRDASSPTSSSTPRS